MTLEELKIALENLEFGKVEYKTKKTRLAVYTDQDRVQTLLYIASHFGGKYSTRSTHSAAGEVSIDDYVVIAKPSDQQNYSNSTKFISEGIANTFIYKGEIIPVLTFPTAGSIQKSIINGCRNDPLLGEVISDQMEELLVFNTLTWDKTVSNRTIQRLGTSIGEPLVGWVAMTSNTEHIQLNNYPISEPIVNFHLPQDPNFPVVDSFLEGENNAYPISSKCSRGAPASFFTGVVYRSLNKYKSLESSVFRDLIGMCLQFGYNKRNDARRIVYDFVLNYIYKLNMPVNVFEDIKYGIFSTNLLKLLGFLDKEPLPLNIRRELPHSISKWFCRVMGNAMINDPKSMEQINQLLQSKDYWQVNLNISAWFKGNIRLDFTQASQAEFRFKSKAAINDFNQSNGWINYELIPNK